MVLFYLKNTWMIKQLKIYINNQLLLLNIIKIYFVLIIIIKKFESLKNINFFNLKKINKV